MRTDPYEWVIWAMDGLREGWTTGWVIPKFVPLKMKRYRPIPPVDEFAEVAVPKQKCR
jgi:hypothetical protein